MDDSDWASSIEAKERDACIQKARRYHITKGTGICGDCHDPVEAERANALRCVSCQQDFEHRQRIKNGGRHV